MDSAAVTANANSKMGRIELIVEARDRPVVQRMAEITAVVNEFRTETTMSGRITARLESLLDDDAELAHQTERIERSDAADLVPSHLLSDRERWALSLSHGNMTPGEKREMLDFLQYPRPWPSDLNMAIVLRILGARARGEHIA